MRLQREKQADLVVKDCAKHVQKWMTDNHGKYWHCFVGFRHSYHIYMAPGIDNTAKFVLDGLFCGRFPISEVIN